MRHSAFRRWKMNCSWIHFDLSHYPPVGTKVTRNRRTSRLGRGTGKIGFQRQQECGRSDWKFSPPPLSDYQRIDDLLTAEEHSAQLHRIFGEETEELALPIELVPNTLLDADTDHENVFREIANGDVVIQGPPGTGKSQVLTNVIGKLLAGNYTTVVVSKNGWRWKSLKTNWRLWIR